MKTGIVMTVPSTSLFLVPSTSLSHQKWASLSHQKWASLRHRWLSVAETSGAETSGVKKVQKFQTEDWN